MTILGLGCLPASFPALIDVVCIYALSRPDDCSGCSGRTRGCAAGFCHRPGI